MLKIEIEGGEPRRVAGTSKRTGNDYEFFTQQAWVDLGARHPEKIEITVRSIAEAYTPGEYYLDPAQSFFVRNNRLEFRPTLTNKPASTKAA